MITSINEFKQYLNSVNENIEINENKIIEIYTKILNQLNDLKDLDVLAELVEGNIMFGGRTGDSDEIRRAYTTLHRELIPAWIDKLWMDNLKSDGMSMNDVYSFADVFEKWIEQKGYESQEVFLSYCLGGGINDVYENEENFKFDLNNIDTSINDIVTKIKSTEVYKNDRGYFKMGFDVMANDGEDNPGFALFAFYDYSSNNIKETNELDGLRPESDDVAVVFKPNTNLFYSYKPGQPYKDMVDLCTDGGYALRLD